MMRIITVLLVTLLSCSALAEKVALSLDNYKWAESDLAFNNVTKRVGSNAWLHFPGLTPLDNQTVVRMNRDTVYSGYIADTSKGATVTLPPTKDGRYLSVMVVQNDHYIDQVFTRPGTYTIKSETPFVMIVARIQIAPSNPNDIENVKYYQQQLVVTNPSKQNHTMPDYDLEQLLVIRAKLVAEGSKKGSLKNMQGPRGTINDEMHRYGTALGWGLLPDANAQYISYYSAGEFTDATKCYAANYQKPPVKATGFFSITVYNQAGWITTENSILNNHNIDYNPDGTFTVHYGNCPVNLTNRLAVEDNWDMLLRGYEPVLSEMATYSLPKITIVKTLGRK